MDNDLLISNIKQKYISYTHYGNSIYSDLWYCDNKNKICITFTPRGGCSISFQQFLDLIGLLNDGLKYNTFIHNYRIEIFLKNIKKINIDELIKNNYTFIKFIMNPYIRAVSIFRCQSLNVSFREHLKYIINDTEIYDNSICDNDKFHKGLQYIDHEEKIITKYIKIDKYETYQVKLANNSLYTFDVNKFTSIHHGKKTDDKSFCGDKLKDDVNKKLPKSYKYFYDDEIQKMVEIIYEKDIKYYGYDFDDFNDFD